jgi:SAM-dependent methyltransferase
MAAHDAVESVPTIAWNTQLHSKSGIVWVPAQMPSLEHRALPDHHFDFVLVNAVWTHVPPENRPAALARIGKLLKPNGSAIVSLRIGPADPKREMYSVNASEFAQQATDVGFAVTPQGDFPDVLGRAEVSWKAYELKLPNQDAHQRTPAFRRRHSSFRRRPPFLLPLLRGRSSLWSGRLGSDRLCFPDRSCTPVGWETHF